MRDALVRRNARKISRRWAEQQATPPPADYGLRQAEVVYLNDAPPEIQPRTGSDG
jgi:hypothetical protein